MIPVGIGQAGQGDRHLPGMAGGLLKLFQRMVNHHARQFFRRGVLLGNTADHFAMAHHIDPIGNLHGLMEFMGNDDDGLSVFLQTADDLKQLLRFLRRQNSRRFVKNQQFGSMVQRLQNLRSLLGSNRQLAHHLHGIDLQSVHFGELPHPIHRGLTLENPEFHRFISHHDVFGHCQMVHQHKMLVNHLDP